MADAPSPATKTLLVFVGLQMGQVMSSLDGTIVATALPSIVDDIGGRSRAPLVVVAYTLAVVASMPLYGKLGDLHGRRRVFLVAIATFLVASMLCGAAQSMEQLLAARFVQGIGGGGLGVLSMATLADIVPARKLGRWLGYQGVVYAVASLLGPLAGGLFVEHLSWRWAFFVNLPVGLVSAGIVASALHLRVRPVRHRLDYPGAVLLTAALAALVVLATRAGHGLPWRSFEATALGLALVGLTCAFVAVERRAAEPVLPLWLLREPVMRAAVGINFTSGLLLWCALFFVPLFLQEVLAVTPTRSGLVLMPLMFGAALGTLITGRFVERSGRYRAWPIAGGLLASVGVALLAALGTSSPAVLAAPLVLLLGTGVGFAMQPSLLAAQNAIAHEHLGIATSTALLFRSLGNTIGTPILGGVLAARLPGDAAGPADYAAALRLVFLTALPVGLLSVLVATRLRDRPLRDALAAEVEPVPAPAPAG